MTVSKLASKNTDEPDSFSKFVAGKGAISKPSSPLRYPGGKTRAVKLLLQYISPDIKKVCSPFLGGGSFELTLASLGIKVYGYDSFSPLINFWQQLLSQPQKLSHQVKSFFPLPHKDFYELQKRYNHIEDKLEQAAAFYTLNRSSFSGTTLSGGMSPGHQRFTEKGINNLANFKASNFTVACEDFTKSITKHKDAFLYCDPPYMNGESLYGVRGGTHKGFDHVGLSHLLHGRKGWILSYNDCPEVRSLYEGCRIIKPEWVYGMGNRKTSSEVLIFSPDVQ